MLIEQINVFKLSGTSASKDSFFGWMLGLQMKKSIYPHTNTPTHQKKNSKDIIENV